MNIGRVADAGVGTGTVVHNLIDKYQKTGVLVSNGGSTAEVAYNEIIGTPSATIAQNGIQASAGVEADIHHNKVSQNIYSPPGTVATGILLSSQPGPTRVHHNDVFLNEDGIGIFTTPDGGVEVSYNNARNNTTDGIVVFDQSAENLIAYNKSFENGRATAGTTPRAVQPAGAGGQRVAEGSRANREQDRPMQAGRTDVVGLRRRGGADRRRARLLTSVAS